MDYDLVVIMSAVTACVLGYPIVKAFVARIERKDSGRLAGGDETLRFEVDDLRARMDVLEQAEHRLTEVEERLDFTERVLTQRTRGELPEGPE